MTTRTVSEAPSAATAAATATAAAAAAFDEIADGVFAFVQPDGGWCLNNAGLVTGTSGAHGRAVLIDTAATETRARRLREHVKQAVPDGPEWVVNTHFHGDHVFGNGQFTPRATVIAHEQTRRDTAEAGHGLRQLWPGVEWGETPLVLPQLTFRDGLTLHTGAAGGARVQREAVGLRVELLHIGPAHTPGDVAAWVPDRSVLFTGDVAWNGVTPYCLMGSVSGSLAALDRLRRLGARTVVPGHGPVGGPEVLDRTEAYLRWVQRLAADGLRAGRTALEAAQAADLGAFGELTDAERLVSNLHRAYAEQEGLEPGARIDVGASFREMVEFHGGPPRCHA